MSRTQRVLQAYVLGLSLTVNDALGQTVPSYTVLAPRTAAYVAPYRASLEWTGAILVARDGHTLLREAYGYSDQARRLLNAPTTRFRLGQITEHFTAAAILLLEQRGALATSDRLARFLPEQPRAGGLTIEQLLAHRACFRNAPDSTTGHTYSYSTPDYKLFRPASGIDLALRAPGVEAAMKVFPSERIQVIALSNVYSSLGHGLADDLLAIARGESPVPPSPHRIVVVPAPTLARYIGRYQLGKDFVSGPTVLEVAAVGDEIALHARDLAVPAHLVPFNDNRFLDRLYGGIVTFSLDTRGDVTALTWKRSRTFVAQRLK